MQRRTAGVQGAVSVSEIETSRLSRVVLVSVTFQPRLQRSRHGGLLHQPPASGRRNSQSRQQEKCPSRPGSCFLALTVLGCRQSRRQHALLKTTLPPPPELHHNFLEPRPVGRRLRPAALHQCNIVVQPDKGGGVRTGQRLAGRYLQPPARRHMADQLPGVGGAPGQVPGHQLPHHDAECVHIWISLLDGRGVFVRPGMLKAAAGNSCIRGCCAPVFDSTGRRPDRCPPTHPPILTRRLGGPLSHHQLRRKPALHMAWQRGGTRCRCQPHLVGTAARAQQW